MADHVILDYEGLPCCYSFLRRRKILLKEKEIDKIRQFDEKNHKCFYPFNDGMHIDAIIDFDEFDLSKSLPEFYLDKAISDSLPPIDFEENRNMYLLIYPDIVFSRGKRQSVIYNISENKLFGAPNSLLEYVELQSGHTIGEVVNDYSREERSVLYSYITFLISNKMARMVSEIKQFELKDQHTKRYKERLENATSIIDSAIIDVVEASSYNIQAVVENLTSLGCGKILIRFFESNVPMFFDALAGIRSSNTIARFDVYAPKEMYLQVRDVLINEPKLFNVFVFQCDESSLFFVNQNILDLRKTFYLSTAVSLSPLDCGKVTFSRTALIPNSDYILRNQFVNSCLYKKISIDSSGLVKNCPSMTFHFGHIKDVRLEDVVKNPKYKMYWYITKDKIETCNHCQYRYSCFDCRAYTKNNALHGLPCKCKFSPALNKWCNEDV